jgi:hypothetical protein
MSEAMADCGISWNTHDPGVVLTHLAVSIADGADCLTDFEALREQSELFGDVASVSTAWRAVRATASTELRHIPKAVAAAREVVWAAAPPGDITIDFDATLVTSHSEKQDARPTYKGGTGSPFNRSSAKSGSHQGQPSTCPQSEHTKSPGQRSQSRWSRHAASVENQAWNLPTYFG